MSPMDAVVWRCTIEDLIEATRAGANRESDDIWPRLAYAKARVAVWEARRLGLYPTTAQLEAETRRAA